jgi:hypothetical protein
MTKAERDKTVAELMDLICSIADGYYLSDGGAESISQQVSEILDEYVE